MLGTNESLEVVESYFCERAFLCSMNITFDLFVIIHQSITCIT